MNNKLLLIPSFLVCIMAILDIDFNNFSISDMVMIILVFITILSLIIYLTKSKRR